MTESKRTSKVEWVDPDDAPELTEEMMAEADIYHGNVLIRRGRPKLPETKTSTTIRLDEDVIQRFKAKGPKWQTRINQALREWLDKAG